MSMTSPYWSMTLVGVAPDAVDLDLDVGLINEPPVTDGRPAGASSVDQVRREALHPPEQRHMVQPRYLPRRGQRIRQSSGNTRRSTALQFAVCQLPDQSIKAND
jgi:hypothetical protein